jgi:hypothetical protein
MHAAGYRKASKPDDRAALFNALTESEIDEVCGAGRCVTAF